MADQIIVLDRAEIRQPRVPVRYSFDVFALFDLGATPIRNASGTVVLVQSASEIREPAYSLLTSGERAAVDNGSHGWEMFKVEQASGRDAESTGPARA